MNLLFYAKTDDGLAGRLRSEIETLVPKSDLDICRTMDDMSRRLRQPLKDMTLGIVFTDSKEDLLGLLLIRDLLLDVKMILILPDKEENTVAVGHALYPRYMSYADGDLQDVVEVIRKCLTISARNGQPQYCGYAAATA
ncbi:MAG: hypothetical protein HQK57_12735 [Deltaproteobacteria bacterium]|nr:hypothetical protein [Deltaproteobacteria bacterium]MBF0527636.1 hypothetical protein [Deltaproteobacteria bacterium]